ncbi:hypothetical protein PUNSTDRAFT_101043 [Punctularia strigosozonata HHB-11173 SS5]|uniref:uncharacterized protein n=1 Tax=Punctularia strigosozonata (strain HHB-11173) TaxID=741275 RepID=UPI0004417FE6|nr:uncharacterized protein PUNSTDRAFT_101043 [Punctularia strigosozonata HHB-11173 SS5]EIN11056.1 hypothetical protein PUNSTDRAFT_101043 [Punctularia strigosozonata HHB-11173 SS5]
MKLARALLVLASATVALGSGVVPYGTVSTTTVTSSTDDSIIPGDIVAVNHGAYGRTEGLVVGSHVDYAGRQVIEVQLDNPTHEVYHAWYPAVTRVKRVVHNRLPAPAKHRTIERHVYY